MSDVFAIFGTLLALGIIVPGTLTACWLLFPNFVGRAASRLEISPWHCLGLGAAAALLVGFPASLLIGLPGSLSKLLGGSLVTITLALAGINGQQATKSRPVFFRGTRASMISTISARARRSSMKFCGILPAMAHQIVSRWESRPRQS